MTDSREEAGRIVKKWLLESGKHQALVDAIAAYGSRARTAAIEEAAKKAESMGMVPVYINGVSASWNNASPAQIAAAIRTLSQQEDGK